MSTHGLVRPLPMSIAGDGFLLPERVSSPEPKEVAVALGGDASLTIDLGSAHQVDTLFVGYTNGNGDEELLFSYGLATADEQEGATLTPAETKRIGPRRHFFCHLEVPVTARYIAITGTLPAGFEIGVVAIGAAFKPGWGPEFGSGRGIVDTGSATRRLDGGFGIVRGERAATWQWTLGDLSDDERDELFGILMDLGETSSVLVFEDLEAGGALGDKLHWSLLQRIEPYERRDPDMNRWGLKLQDWA